MELLELDEILSGLGKKSESILTFLCFARLTGNVAYLLKAVHLLCIKVVSENELKIISQIYSKFTQDRTPIVLVDENEMVNPEKTYEGELIGDD